MRSGPVLSVLFMGLALSSSAVVASDPPATPGDTTQSDPSWLVGFPTVKALIASLTEPTASTPPPSRAADAPASVAPVIQEAQDRQGLGESLSALMEELRGRPEEGIVTTSTTRAVGTPCKEDPAAFRQPFSRAVLYGPAFAAWDHAPGQVQLERASGVGDPIPLVAQSDPSWGWRAEIPDLPEGPWYMVAIPPHGRAVCTRVEVRAAPPPEDACPVEGEAAALCRLLVLKRDRRYGEIPALLAGAMPGSERARLGALVACSLGRDPRDLDPLTTERCKDLAPHRNPN